MVELLCERWGIDPAARSQFDAHVGEGIVAGQHCVVARPQSYMNRSGLPVASLAKLYQLPCEHLLVVHDDLDLDFRVVKCKARGGHGGHNGLRDIHAHLGPDYSRVRVGIGRPPPDCSVPDHVLGGWTDVEWADQPSVVSRAADAVEVVLSAGLRAAMNRFNVREAASPTPTPPINCSTTVNESGA